MKLLNSDILLSPSDLVALYKCDLAFSRIYQVATDALKHPVADDFQQLLFELGQSHEAAIKEQLQRTYSFLEIARPSMDLASLESARGETLKAMNDGVEIIYQGTLFADGILGYPDFLRKVINPESGDVSYEPIDAKSASTAKVEAIIQTATYAYLLQRMGRPLPIHIHLWLGSGEQESFETTRFVPIVKKLIAKSKEALAGPVQADTRTWADKRPACEQCEWKKVCISGRETARDLSLVQGMRSDALLKLRNAAIHTIDDLARASDRPSDLSAAMFEKLRSQAALQIKAEESNSERPEFEIKDAKVLQNIPSPDFGDVYFDIEGNPLANSGKGLEYLLGVWFRLPDETFHFKSWWADNSMEEKKSFEDFIDWIMKRRVEYPNLHIYHYADYERAAIRRLAGRHNTRIEEVDTLLKAGVLFDYYKTVRTGIRISTKSLSIKDVEAVYGESHGDQEVSSAADSVLKFNRYMALRQSSPNEAMRIKQDILDYNEKDVETLQKLNDWIRAIEYDRLDVQENQGQSSTETKRELDPTYLELMTYVPEDIEERSVVHRAIAMVAALVEFQQREEKPVWWEFFDYAEGDLSEWGTDGRALAVKHARVVKEWHQSPRRWVRHTELTFDMPDAGRFFEGSLVLLYGSTGGNRIVLASSGRSFSPKSLTIDNLRESIVEVKGDKIIVQENAGKDKLIWEDTPIGAIKFDLAPTANIVERLQNLAKKVLSNLNSGLNALDSNPWTHLLLSGLGANTTHTYVASDSKIEDITSELLSKSGITIGVQGPPGTGKTYVGARVIAKLAKDHGWKIAVCSQSNAAIENLLTEIQQCDPAVAVAKETGTSKNSNLKYSVENTAEWIKEQKAGYVVGATIFKLTSRHTSDMFDLVVIEEAGQFSLAHSIAALSFGERGLLLGDPQQLPQVSQGFHPEPVNESALTHLLQGESVIADHLGYFLDTSYRMHTEVTKAVSHLQYRSKLQSAPVTAQRNLEGIEPGIHPVAVQHQGNRVESKEEADKVLEIVNTLLGRAWKSSEKDSVAALTESDVIVVTPYNAQRRLITETLSKANLHQIRVGTVDKFQGQEAAVVIVSYAASSDSELPRGLDFLFSPNRLNVAISRAQWCAYLIHSTELLNLTPSSPASLEAYGGFLGVVTKDYLSAG